MQGGVRETDTEAGGNEIKNGKQRGKNLTSVIRRYQETREFGRNIS